jgi:4a-hydroxytetrahydrobiopterin dehydratase
MKLADKQCVPCTGSVPPLEKGEAAALLEELDGGWMLNGAARLQRVYTFADFAGAIAFADQAGIIAELEGHHPDLHVSWGACVVEIWTHAIDGLTESDFILAAKIQRMADARLAA